MSPKYLTRFASFMLMASLSISYAMAQETRGQIIDVESKQGISFARITSLSDSTDIIADINGGFRIKNLGDYEFNHPMYHQKITSIDLESDSITIQLIKISDFQIDELQYKKGERIFNNYHDNLPQTGTLNFPEFEFLSATNITVYEQNPDNPDTWSLLNSMKSIEKNRYKYPNKKYSRVVKSYFSDGDSSDIGFIPINTYSISEDNEYIKAVNAKYYNPLFKEAAKRYDYALVDSFRHEGATVHAILFQPDADKSFVGLQGVLYFINSRSEPWGAYLLPSKNIRHNFSIALYLAKTSKNTRFLKEQYVVLRLKNIPDYGRNSVLSYSTSNTSPVFSQSSKPNEAKWVDMALFNYQKDSAADDTWMMRQMVDNEKLEYIKKDTTEKQFVLSNTLRWMYNIYDGKLGYRLKFFDINNEFAINRFESVRIGLGLQSHENLSDAFTFGGYFAYGIGDGKFKYGGNFGLYVGEARQNLLSVRYTRDLLEPGRVHYMDTRQDLVRDFFTSRMDEYFSTILSFRSRINAYFTSTLQINNYSLKPLYEYIYNPTGIQARETQTFNFTETSFLFNIGTPFSNNPNLRNILYRHKRVQSNLFLNLTKGWNVENGGNFDYWKINGRLNSNIRLTNKKRLHVTVDGGVMSKDQPYQINYVGPGTEFKLTGIIINNAFQSMQLYGFFADRYVHSFIDYNLGKLFKGETKFNPDLALALNAGWGRIAGRKDIHENIEVRDYPNGYYEAGFLLNNLLRLKIYNYFYGGLGLGTFYGFGPDAKNGAWAIRISYEIGVL